MNEEVLDDLRFILKDGKLLGEFIKIDDINEMYDFCRCVCKEHENPNYSKKEFLEQIESLINGLPGEIYSNTANEW